MGVVLFPQNERRVMNINVAQHPARIKAIQVMEAIAEYMNNPTMFDCLDHDTTWYDVEDIISEIING